MTKAEIQILIERNKKLEQLKEEYKALYFEEKMNGNDDVSKLWLENFNDFNMRIVELNGICKLLTNKNLMELEFDDEWRNLQEAN